MTTTVERIKRLDLHLLKEICLLEAEAYGDGGFDRWTLPVFARNGCLFILRLDGDVVGTAELMRDWDDYQMVYLAGFAIKKNNQGKGLGERLLGGVIHLLREDKNKELRLTVAPDNKAALWLYKEKFGFRELMYSKDEYGAGQDRILLSLDLTVD